MSDFAQAGLITTLQQLNHTHARELEAQVETHTAAHPVTLVLPCHARDLAAPAVAHIVGEISRGKYLREIIVCVNGFARADRVRARAIFAAMPQPHRVICTDNPEVAPLLAELCGGRVAFGKGVNIWLGCGIVFAEKDSQVIVTQDCDVISFRQENLARLCFAAVHPELRYLLAKMFYSRATDRIYGRVSRLFFTPLVAALTRICGHRPLLDFLQSFRYPLAGEMALSRELAGVLPMHGGWGIELGVLCESFRHADSRQIAQIDGGPNYEHRHHPLGNETGGTFPHGERGRRNALCPAHGGRGPARCAVFCCAPGKFCAGVVRRRPSLAAPGFDQWNLGQWRKAKPLQPFSRAL